MGLTITEKILADHAGLKKVSPGELIDAEVDVVMGHDLSAPLAIKEMERIGGKQVFDPRKIIIIPDHFTPNKDVKTAEICKDLRGFSRKQGIVHFFEVGRMGISHALLPEQGLVLPGDLVVGGDSHTCTYGALGCFSTGIGSTDLAAAMMTGRLWFKVPESMKFIYEGELNRWVCGKDLILHTIGDIGVDGALYSAMEFTGSTIGKLAISDRLTMANMAVEAGAKNGIFEVDKNTEEYIRPRASRPFKIFQSDPDASYADIRTYDVTKIELQVAAPHLPSNTKPVGQLDHISIDQVVIGSCTNGRIEDLRSAAKVLNGNKVAPNVRLIIIPATQQIYRQALQEGLFEIFIDADAAISTPTCGPCVGAHMGLLASGERAVSTTNRNFIGRMGDPSSEIYLANPAVAAASAVTGRITHPDEVLRDKS